MTKTGRPLNQTNRDVILGALAGDPGDFFEIGTPPYSVGLLSEQLKLDPSNLRKALLRLETEGLVVREYRKVATWNAIAKNHIPRKCLCFWNVSTMEKDKAAAEEWTAGAKTRSSAAFDRMF